MPILIPQIKGELSDSRDEIIEKAVRSAGIKQSDVSSADIYKISVDARKHDKNGIHFVYSVMVSLKDKSREQLEADRNKLTYSPDASSFPDKMKKVRRVNDKEKRGGRIVIAGFGPAGMFCALVLAENGYEPIVVERGSAVDERVKKVSAFWNGGELDENTNVQFGEGGAGTFSDGKLTTRIKDPLCRYVLERLVGFGAPEVILSRAKPHIGTDKLTGIVKSLRERIIEVGGEVHFDTRLDGITVSDGREKSVRCVDKSGDIMDIECSCLVAAIGHSARDTAEMLIRSGVVIEQKPFAVGVRIEHKQSAVDESLYGKYAGDKRLPKGEYQMSYTQKDGQSCYTFCMCPGGVVVPAASESGGVVVNGMSEFARSGENANSALVTAVNGSSFGSGILDGMEFARKIERRAFAETGGYFAPATSVKGFLEGRPSLDCSVSPTYARGVKAVDFEKIFPSKVTDMLKKGLSVFAGRMKCFGDGGALLTAPETRTSSPIRIVRGERLNAVGIENLYPCGEGAGYAGGITSSAVDGIKTAISIAESFGAIE